MKRAWTIAAAIIAWAVAVPGGAAPVGPVVNGDFELVVPVKQQMCDTFGDGAINVLDPDDDPDLEDPTDPDSDLPWPWLVSLTACESGAVKALHWSSSRVSQWSDVDGDGDREVVIDGSVALPPDDSIGKSHNFWQAYPSPHQAYSANFGSLTYRVEDGVIPSSARVHLVLSTTPGEVPAPWFGIFFNCQLIIRDMAPDENGLVTIDPVDGTLISNDPDCDVLAAAWDSASDQTRRTILGRTRIVQLSFWNFNSPDATVTLDDVSINDSRFWIEDAIDESL